MGAQGAALLSENEAKRIARHEGDLSPDDVAASAAAVHESTSGRPGPPGAAPP